MDYFIVDALFHDSALVRKVLREKGHVGNASNSVNVVLRQRNTVI